MKLMKFSVWCGLIFQNFALIGWWVVANMFPLHSPAADASEISAFFIEHATAVKLGCIIMWFGFIPCAIFYGTISTFIRKVQHEAADMLANAQMLGAVFNMLTIGLASYLWVTIAFRPERSPEIIHVLNDFAWINITAPFWSAPVQILCVGIAVLIDKAATPVFPRWYGFLSLWVVFLSFTNVLIPFFYSGPFAWTGIFGFWLPAVVFGVFVIATTYVFLQVLKKEESADSASAVVGVS